MIGARLKQYRQRCHLSQEALAQAMGMPPNTISKIEHGTRKMSLDEAIRFATIFGMTLEAFAGTADAGIPQVVTLLAHQCVTKVQEAEVALKAASQVAAHLDRALSVSS